MSDTLTPPKTIPAVSSWAAPTTRDDEVWQDMTRDQQLAALQGHFSSNECTEPTMCTVAQIVAQTRKSRSAL